MSWNKVILLTSLVGFFLLPVMFNACQPGFKVKSGASDLASSDSPLASAMSLCKNTSLQPSGFHKSAGLQSSVFLKSKLVLDELLINRALSQKASLSDDRLTDLEMALLVDNQCLEGFQDQIGLLSVQAASDENTIEGLDRQIYRLKIRGSYTRSDLNQWAEEDPCLIGLSLNHAYRVSASPAEVTPMPLNDSFLSEQHHLQAINATQAFTKLYGQGGIQLQSTEKDVVIAVIDSGIDWQHPDLEKNIWKFKVEGETFYGIDATTLGTDLPINYNPVDLVGHGTHVAGVIAAVGNNSRGIAGVMPFRSKIMAVKVFANLLNPDTGEYEQIPDTASIVNGIRWAALQGADVINLSLGRLVDGVGDDPFFRDVIEEILPVGVTVVTAAGNGDSEHPAQSIDNETFSVIPAIYGERYEGVIAVGSSDAETKERSYFSHYSSRYIELAAPGTQKGATVETTGIYSTFPPALHDVGTGYQHLQGTSMSTPQVSAAAALVIGWVRERYGVTPHPCIVEGLILESAQKLDPLKAYYKDGNHLDLLSLAETLEEYFPNP